MGLFDAIREVGDQIYAHVDMAVAKHQMKSDPLLDELSAKLDLQMTLDEDDRKTLEVLRDVLGYGNDAYIAMAHIDNISALVKDGKDVNDIAKSENISEDMVKRIFQMKEEYAAYVNTGIIPKFTARECIGGALDRQFFENYRYKKWYGDDLAEEVEPKAKKEKKKINKKEKNAVDILNTNNTPSDNNASYADIATGAQSTINTMSDAISAAEK